MSQLRGQIAHQKKRNNDLFASNASLRKINAELTVQLEELKSKNEELATGHSILVERNAELTKQVDSLRDELSSEKAVSVGLKAELETAAEKIQTIAVDAVLSARAELMGEFKRGEHSSWDPDEEIETWTKREAVLAGGEAASDEEEDDEGAPAVESPKQKEDDVAPEQGEPDAGAEVVTPEPEDAAASAKDLAKD